MYYYSAGCHCFSLFFSKVWSQITVSVFPLRQSDVYKSVVHSEWLWHFSPKNRPWCKYIRKLKFQIKIITYWKRYPDQRLSRWVYIYHSFTAFHNMLSKCNFHKAKKQSTHEYIFTLVQNDHGWYKSSSCMHILQLYWKPRSQIISCCVCHFKSNDKIQLIQTTKYLFLCYWLMTSEMMAFVPLLSCSLSKPPEKVWIPGISRLMTIN